MRNPPIATRPQGFTLLELSFVMVAAFVIMGIALAANKNVQNSASSKGAIDAAAYISAAIKATYTMPDYTGLNVGSFIAAGGVPAGLLNTAGNGLINGWGGAIVVTSSNYGAGFNNAYLVRFYAVPTAGCNQLIAGAQGNFNIVKVGQGVVATTVVKDDSATPAVPYTVAGALAACANPTNLVALTGT